MTFNSNALQVRSMPTVAARIARAVRQMPASFLGLILLVVVAWIFRPALLSPLLLLAILKQAACLGVATIGQSLVMRARSIDLSIGGTVVVAIWIVTSGVLPLPVPALLLLAVAAGALVGGVNGIIVTRFRASAVIVTLAMSIALVGAVVAVSQYRQPGEVPGLLRFFGSGRVASFPVAAIVWIAVLVPAAVFLRTTVFGRYLDAMGNNPGAAAISGIPQLRIVFLSHLASGVTAAVAGLLLVGTVSVGNTNLGQDLVLNSLAAVTLGGVNFGAGKGGMAGPAAGALMLTFLFSLLVSFGLDAAGKYMVQGAIIAVAAILFTFRER